MTTSSIPFLPDNAPFTSDQRAWLNGFLAGLYSSAPTQQAGEKAAGQAVTVYFATQSGTAERLAKKFAKDLKLAGHTVVVTALNNVTLAQMATVGNAVLFVSTYGDGEAPEETRSFQQSLLNDSEDLAALRYAVFALGDRNYEQFCAFGIEVDERLAALGGQRLTARLDSDVEVDEPFAAWKSVCIAALGKTDGQGATPVADSSVAVAPAPARFSRDNPYQAAIVEQRPLTAETSDKLTVHLALKLHAEIGYEAGDACGVLPQNDAALVDETLSLLGVSSDETVTVPKIGTCTVREALLHHYQHTRLTRKLVRAFATKSQCKTLSALLPPEQSGHLDAFMHDRGLIDLLHEYPGVFSSAEELLSHLPRLAPRLYSISSSPAKHGSELHCTIAVVRYRSHNRERGGVASTMLAERTKVGDAVPVYIQPNRKFRLPQNTETPIIMIGPGTGIAPFRSFLHEREATGHKGRNWLFFGERSAQTDFLYCQELQAMQQSGHLTRFDTAFSRDQSHKIYVQDRMVEQGAQFWSWLQEGAHVYVCGDASRMAKDVDAALHRVIGTHGSMGEEQAREYVSQMHDDGRYLRDVY